MTDSPGELTYLVTAGLAIVAASRPGSSPGAEVRVTDDGFLSWERDMSAALIGGLLDLAGCKAAASFPAQRISHLLRHKSAAPGPLCRFDLYAFRGA